MAGVPKLPPIPEMLRNMGSPQGTIWPPPAQGTQAPTYWRLQNPPGPPTGPGPQQAQAPTTWWQQPSTWDNSGWYNWRSGTWIWNDAIWDWQWQEWESDYYKGKGKGDAYKGYDYDYKGKGKGKAFPMAPGAPAPDTFTWTDARSSVPPLGLQTGHLPPPEPQGVPGPRGKAPPPPLGDTPRGDQDTGGKGGTKGTMTGNFQHPQSVTSWLTGTGGKPPPPKAPVETTGESSGANTWNATAKKRSQSAAPAFRERSRAPAPGTFSATGRDLPKIKEVMDLDQEFMKQAHRAFDKLGAYDVVDYIDQEYPNWLDTVVTKHGLAHDVQDEDLEYCRKEWAKCVLRQMLHLGLGIFRDRQNWATWKDLVISWDGRLLHPVDHYIINTNPRHSNPPCPIQLTGIHEVSYRAKAAPGKTQRDQENWSGRDRTSWFGDKVIWPPQSAPIPTLVTERRKGQDPQQEANKCLLCGDTGHGFRNCLWYWAWLIGKKDEEQEAIGEIPAGAMGFCEKHLEVLMAGIGNGFGFDETIGLGILVINNQINIREFQRRAHLRNKEKLAAELGHPPNWEDMTMDELHRLRGQPGQQPSHQEAKAKARPKATGTHSAANYKANANLFEQQAQQHALEEAAEKSDKSCESVKAEH